VYNESRRAKHEQYQQNPGGGGLLNGSKQGFTLAEVLITLGIIGIVATLTMPSLVASYQEKVTVTQLKKFYSMMSQSFSLAVTEHGPIEGWSVTHEEFANRLLENAKLSKTCGLGAAGCFSKVLSKSGGSYYDTITTTQFSAVLLDGTLVGIGGPSDCTGVGSVAQVCTSLNVDINGSKPPGTYGIDNFQFYITRNGLVPMGTNVDMASGCYLNYLRCTAWVLANENTGYLRCDDLSWDGKIKCD
jgi:prepilin-type N-terminal cleavage/methylation domain-containing protein